MFEFEQTAFCIMKTFQVALKKKTKQFGIYLFTYLHPLETATPSIHTHTHTHTGSTLHIQMMMLIFDDQLMSG